MTASLISLRSRMAITASRSVAIIANRKDECEEEGDGGFSNLPEFMRG